MACAAGTARLPGRPGAGSGFTFIEMMVVIAIIGILSTLVVANLDKLSVRGRLASSARSFGNQLLVLKDTASLQQRSTFLEVDLEKERWRVVDVPSPNEIPDPDEREEATWYASWQELPDGIDLETIAFNRSDAERSGSLTISFSADGELSSRSADGKVSASGFVAYFVHEELPAEEGWSVEVTGLTGLVSYHNLRTTPDEVRDADE